MLFTKAPSPGTSKTRLTKARGGTLTSEEAVEFYTASLLDLVEMSFIALNKLKKEKDNNMYDFVVCCSQKSDIQKLENLLDPNGPWHGQINYILDQGFHFNERFDNAFHQLFELGFHSVVAIGGDIPTMPMNHIIQAFEWLHYFSSFSENGGVVLAPCQECGISLVGYTTNTLIDSIGVFYNSNGICALDAYITKAAEQNVPVAILTPIADVDNANDLINTASVLRAIAYSSSFQSGTFVAKRTINWLKQAGIGIWP